MNRTTTCSTSRTGSCSLIVILIVIVIREFTFDVDVSQLPCGLNGALYFVEMDEDGGKSKFPTNKVEMIRIGKVILPLVALRQEPPLAQASITIINQ